jgi:N-acetylneuraminic acid mutarotase
MTHQSGVPPRARRSAVGAAIGSTLYAFGGVGAATGGESFLDVSDDLWALVLWGGSGVAEGAHTFLADLWRFAPATETWEQLDAGAGPEARYVPVFTTLGDGIVLFGGYTEDARGGRKLADTWLLDPSDGWTALDDGPGPPARYGAMAAATERGVTLFGGFSDRDLDDAWLLDEEGRWHELTAGAPRPAARYYGAVAARGDELLVFGGRSRAHPKENHNDLWTLDIVTQSWRMRTPDREPHRYDAGARYPGYHAKSATAVIDGSLYLWAGEGLVGHVSDLWRLELSTLEWELLQSARDDDPRLW